MFISKIPALNFFNKNKIPVNDMRCMDELSESENDFIFAKEGEVYLIYSKYGEPVMLELPDIGYNVVWFNPKTGEEIVLPDATTNESIELNCPAEHDWLLYLSK